MKAPVSASLGAMGSLLEKLDLDPEDDLGRTRRLPKGVKNGMHILKEDLEEIGTYLHDLLEVDDPPLTAKSWMKEVRELSYDIEDYIDRFAQPGHSATFKARSIRKIRHVVISGFPKKKKKKKLKRRKGMVDMISEFGIRAQGAIERHERYELGCRDLRRRFAPIGPMLPTPYEEGADLVIDGWTSEFIEKLANDGDEQLKVVSVVGSGGIGKTTLARVLYKKLRGQFDCRAFVKMNQNPDIKIVVHDMLTQLQRNDQAHDDCHHLDHISKIREYLQDKRYLIIVDDLWAAPVWDIINNAFPEGRRRSRIIITTQIDDVAFACCCYHPEYVFEMKPLDVDHSRKLFFNRFGYSESDCPQEFKEISYKIVEKCGGFPLATINMASLLASQPVVLMDLPVVLMEQWTYICDSLSTGSSTNSTSEGTRSVINLSYNNLTHYLKTCLLYLNMYPEGCTICKDDLVKQWVAEGFIGAAKGRDMEKVAESYFDELVGRRFLQPARIKYNNEVVSCTVHDMVRDLIAYKSAQENFIMVVDYYRKNVELSDKVHRLSIHFGEAKYAKTPGNIITSQVRSFTFFGLFKCMPSISEFKLLCILNLKLSGHNGEETLDLSGISELFQLRYFKVASDVCIELPKHMKGLQNLETLDIDTKVTDVPWDITHLPCLLHLRLPFETNLMDRIGSMRPANVQSLGKLTNLQDLRLTCSTPPPDHLERNVEALGSLLGGLGNLKTLALVCDSSHRNAVVHCPSEAIVSWDGITAALLLQRFEWSPCRGSFSRVPKWIGKLHNLCILKIAVRELLMDDVDVLRGLPALTALSLNVQTAPVERIVFGKAGFSVLKYFKFRCSLPWLKFEDAMPKLRKLKLVFNAHSADQNDSTHISIEHLSCLKEISAKIGAAGADPKSVLTAAVINHPSNPKINAQSVDWILCGDEDIKKVGSKPAIMTEDAMVSAFTGAMNSLLVKLATLLGEQYAKLTAGTRKEFMILKDELDAMKTLLEQLAGMAELSAQMRDSRNQMREMTYDIEDCIDDLMVHIVNEKVIGYPEKRAQLSRDVTTLLQNFTDQIYKLKAQLEEADLRSMVPRTEMHKGREAAPGKEARRERCGGQEVERLGILQIPKLADLQMDNVSDNASEMPADLPWQLLEEITNGFSEEREIGRGGYGVVYKGVFTNGEEIAVKKLYHWLLDDTQFQNELQKLTIFRHQNIVRLVGKSYVERERCVEHEGKQVCAMIDRAICFEYLDNGSLEKHLCDEYSGLSWHCRYKIIKGICDGLKYLHGRGIFHLDLKPANILLDKNMVPKIADFNLSRLFSGTRQSHTTSKFIGTRGYMPPEYIKQGKISEKLDVFSLGVIIIGIMTGPKGYSKQSDMSSQDFIEQVLENWRNRPQEQWKDKSYLDVFCQQVKICIEIALNCVETDRHKRPSIEDIISKLNESETMIEKSDKINKLKAQLEEADLGSKVPRTEMRSLGPSYMSREQWLSFDEGNGLVGMDGPRDELVRRLIGSGDEQDKLQGVCILGVAGIGKTMLATQVYNEIKRRFDRCVFISASKKVDTARLCRSILLQLQETVNSNRRRYLINRVRKNLQDKRFLIVIDGVWSAQIVEDIKAALPENNRGSRIITTSGISDVADSCGKHFSSFIYQMKPLTFEESLGLFRSIIFGSGRSCPVASEKVYEEIVKACGGIPLALRLIAGALASKPAEMEQWVTFREIMKQAGTDHLNVEWMRKIFDISYSDLSCDMKTCLLYLSAFPENHVIRKDRLITRWVAEGFLLKRCGKTWWETGESYFLELVARNLVNPVYDEEDVLPIGCKVSGSVHDFITSLSSEENFVKSDVTDPTCMQRGVFRRLSVDLGSDNQEILLDLFQGALSSKVRSLTFVDDFGWMPDLSAFKHVRVLDLKDNKRFENEQLKSIGRLSLLRYLGLGGTGVTELPQQIMALEQLTTLDIRRTGVRKLPAFRDTKLVFLLADELKMRRGMGGMQKLEELSKVRMGPDVAGLFNKLRRLRMLGVRFSRWYAQNQQEVKHFVEEVGKSNLHSLFLDNYPHHLLFLLVDSWAHKRPHHLREIELRIAGCLPLVPKEMASLIALTHLHINVKVVGAQGVRALGNLPNLVLLVLKLCSDTSPRLAVSSKDGFQCLKVFCYLNQHGGGMGLQFEAGAMPQLRRLVLDFNVRETISKYGDFDFGVQHLSYLVQVRATMDCLSATPSEVEAAEANMRDQVSQNPNHPVLEWKTRQCSTAAAPAPAEGSVIAIHGLDEWIIEIDEAKVTNKLVVIFFTASWCRPSVKMAPVFADIAKKFPNVVFLKVDLDVDETKRIVKGFGVLGSPTFLFMKGGLVKDRLRGAYKEGLVRKLKLQMAQKISDVIVK